MSLRLRDRRPCASALDSADGGELVLAERVELGRDGVVHEALDVRLGAPVLFVDGRDGDVIAWRARRLRRASRAPPLALDGLEARADLQLDRRVGLGRGVALQAIDATRRASFLTATATACRTTSLGSPRPAQSGATAPSSLRRAERERRVGAHAEVVGFELLDEEARPPYGARPPRDGKDEQRRAQREEPAGQATASPGCHASSEIITPRVSTGRGLLGLACVIHLTVRRPNPTPLHAEQNAFAAAPFSSDHLRRALFRDTGDDRSDGPRRGFYVLHARAERAGRRRARGQSPTYAARRGSTYMHPESHRSSSSEAHSPTIRLSGSRGRL